MGIPLTRRARPEDLEAGQWCNDVAHHTFAMMSTIVICCPGCSAKTDLTFHHLIEHDGKVQPAFACSTCPFFDHVELVGWRQLS